MFHLSQDDRQMIKDQHVNQRTTRQNDNKKRNTNNSSFDETTSPYYLKDNLMPKKQKNNCNESILNKININNNNNNNNTINSINPGTLKNNKDYTSNKTPDYCQSIESNNSNFNRGVIHQTKLFSENEKENCHVTLSDQTKENSNKSIDNRVVPDNCESNANKESGKMDMSKNSFDNESKNVAYICKSANVSLSNIKESVKVDISKYSFENENTNILGVGHLHLIHLFTRDFLFKKIKILSDHHLERQGLIMNKMMEKLNYSENINGNYIAFTNAVRTEIKKTMCAKRGYVKRQIGLLLKGMKKLFQIKFDINLFF